MIYAASGVMYDERMILLVLALLGQQTECTTIGATTRCTKESAPVDLTSLAKAPAQAVPATSDGSMDRRAAAYAQVGQLIADKRCEDALRLARFYGKKDLIKDTERACVK